MTAEYVSNRCEWNVEAGRCDDLACTCHCHPARDAVERVRACLDAAERDWPGWAGPDDVIRAVRNALDA